MNDSAKAAARLDAHRPGRGGSALAALSLLCIGLLIGGIAVGVAVGGVMPLPYGPASAVSAYVRAQPAAVRIIAVATFASAVPLAIYAAIAGARLRQLGVGSGAVALSGGTLAAGALGLAGLLGWTLSIPDVAADAAVVRALYLLVFLTGGPGHIVALGLLVGGIAAPGLTRRLMPGPLARMGVATAVLAELAAAVLIWPALGVILPIARVLALTWLMVAGVALSHAAQRDSAAD
ncbi:MULTISPECIES: hypothetical protein [Mycobacterium]|uniref:DUF4386 domain-containing protein n=1 Tax=Mycobacterium colombiense TaxID=339268 RepID=A0A329MBU7_9MYCO|nr:MULTISPECIES: hypothetical protein [Mycobacterium]MDM4141837.1 hypothetical protein [Mycobacterium sp. FLAC0960]RAV17555.1 hypothetical protein DQP57_00595 [Mycobacterium colombiense]